jgi:hypothetical protein
MSQDFKDGLYMFMVCTLCVSILVGGNIAIAYLYYLIATL